MARLHHQWTNNAGFTPLMSNSKRSPNPLKILSHLKKTDDGERKIVDARSLDPQLFLLREWQTNRLKKTYANFYNDPQYLLAIEFFLNDIYSPRDFSQRDLDPAPVLVSSGALFLGHIDRDFDAHILALTLQIRR